MSTVRVDELAQEYGMSPDELFTQLKAMGFDVVNVTSSVDRKLVDMVSDMLAGKPRERSETSKRRIVSVRKGESVPEVEVRLEDEVLEEEMGLDDLALLVDGEDPAMVGKGMDDDRSVLSGLDNLIKVTDATGFDSLCEGTFHPHGLIAFQEELPDQI